MFINLIKSIERKIINKRQRSKKKKMTINAQKRRKYGMKYQGKIDIYPTTCNTERERAEHVEKRKVN